MYRPEVEPPVGGTTAEQAANQTKPDARVLTLQDPNALPEDANNAFTSIYKEYSVPLQRFATGILGSSDIASDAVQESLIKAWKNIDSFDAKATDASLSRWLYRITRNTALNIKRSKSWSDVSYEETMAGPRSRQSRPEDDPQTHLEFKEEIGVVASLSNVIRESLSWDLQDTSYEEIARQTGLSLPAVKARLVRAREASREARRVSGLTEAEKEAEKEAKKAARRARKEARELEKREEDLVAA